LSRKVLKGFWGGAFLAEPHFNYWAGLAGFGGDRYLSGYWQSERYFLHVQERIRTEFTFKKPLEGANAQMARAISDTTSISVHVRRGDYLTNPKNHGLMDVAQPAYYRSAIAHIGGIVTNPEFFVFSDDIVWAKENITSGYPCTFINHNSQADSYFDMYLMSRCQHHIIANSTFSWWAAWLNPSDRKIVIAPKKWFARSMPIQDLLPPDWIRL